MGFERDHRGVVLTRVDGGRGGEVGRVYACLQQRPEWLDFLARGLGVEPVVAEVNDAEGERLGYFYGAIKKVGPLRILGSPLPGWSTLYMGFALQPDVSVSMGALLRALERFAWGELRCVHLEICDRSMTRDALAQGGFAVQPGSHTGWEVDLTPTEDELWMGLKPACRRAVRKATKSGVTVREVVADEAFIAGYYAQMHEVFGRQGLAPTYGLKRIRALVDALGAKGRLMALRVVGPDGDSIASGLFPHGDGVVYFWGGYSRQEALALRPNDILHWEAMVRARRIGCSRYDLAGQGGYKHKFGAYRIDVPAGRRSRIPLLESARTVRERGFRMGQRIRGALGRRSMPRSSDG